MLKFALDFIAKLDNVFLKESIIKEYSNIHSFIRAVIALEEVMLILFSYFVPEV